MISTLPPSLSRRNFLTVGGLALASAALTTGATRLYAAEAKSEGNANQDGIENAMPQSGGVFEVAPLLYAYSALEPSIDEQTMQLHHNKHYAGYTKKLNAALEQAPELKEKSIEELLSNVSALPESVRKAIRNNGGGYYNHSLFWRMMGPNAGGEPTGEIATAINQKFGSFDDFRTKFSEEAGTVFGSGWAWLVVTDGGDLEITSTPNQDSPIMNGIAEVVGKPVLGVDVWEHAYYLKYKNERGQYVKSWWDVVNWDTVNDLYAKAKA